MMSLWKKNVFFTFQYINVFFCFYIDHFSLNTTSGESFENIALKTGEKVYSSVHIIGMVDVAFRETHFQRNINKPSNFQPYALIYLVKVNKIYLEPTFNLKQY